MQHGNARPLAVKYISDPWPSAQRPRRAVIRLLEIEAGLRGCARCVKVNAERAGQIGGLFQINRFIFGHVFEQRLMRSSDPDCCLIKEYQTLQMGLAHTEMVGFGTAAWRSTGATLWTPLWLSYLAKAYADLEEFDDAWRCVEEAKTTVTITKERWYEAELYRMAGEIARKPAEGASKLRLTVACAQHAKRRDQ